MFAKNWQPFGAVWSEMNRMQNEMEAAFGRSRRPGPWRWATASYPPLNIREDDDNLFVEAELPGLNQADLEIYVERNNQLTIKGKRNEPQVEEGTWHRRERSFGEFSRVVELSENVDADKVNANFKQGVLTIVLPKTEEVKPRRIEVKSD